MVPFSLSTVTLPNLSPKLDVIFSVIVFPFCKAVSVNCFALSKRAPFVRESTLSVLLATSLAVDRTLGPQFQYIFGLSVNTTESCFSCRC